VSDRMAQSSLRFSAIGALAFLFCADARPQTAAGSTCPTCAPYATEALGGPGGFSASTVHCADPAPMTAAIAEEFDLQRLTAFLEQAHVVVGRFGAGSLKETAPPGEPTATIAFSFDVGEFTYYKKTADAEALCEDRVAAPARVAVRVGSDLLSFEADGRLWRSRSEPLAHFYAAADLATATGSYRPVLDETRPHVGIAEVALYVAPGHLRGDLGPFVLYFRNEAWLQRYRQGESWAFSDGASLFRLGFPEDVCTDNELPFAFDQRIELLAGVSAVEWRARAVRLMGGAAVASGVWEEGNETGVAIELGAPVEGAACLGRSYHPAPVTELALRLPLAGRLSSSDGRLDLPLDELMVRVDRGVLVRATVRSSAPATRLTDAQRRSLGSNVDWFSAWVSYDFECAAPMQGRVELMVTTSANSRSTVERFEFPALAGVDVSGCIYE
jgi:hypothetical protein